MEQKYIYFFIAFIILIVILYFAGYNVMKAYYESQEIINKKINNFSTQLNNKIIHKKLSMDSNNININDINGINDNSNGIGVLRDSNWRNKVKNHMNYQHGNPFMYNKPVKVLYDDL
jgi:hypothetical protein